MDSWMDGRLDRWLNRSGDGCIETRVVACTIVDDHIYTQIMSPRSQNYTNQTAIQALNHMHCENERLREGKGERQRETARQAERQTDGQKDRQTEKDRERERSCHDIPLRAHLALLF